MQYKNANHEKKKKERSSDKERKMKYANYEKKKRSSDKERKMKQSRDSGSWKTYKPRVKT